MNKKETAQDKVSALFELFDEIKDLRDEKQKEASLVDVELSGLYHKIEGIEITHISQSHNLIKELKIVLLKRRNIKIESNLLRSVVDSVDKNITGSKKRYNEILGKHSEIIEEIKFRAK